MPEKKPSPKFRATNVPEELKAIDSWLVWKMVPNPVPGKKPLKVPYYVSGKKRMGTIGTKQDRSRLTNFDRANAAYLDGDYDGLGFAVFPDFDLTIIDLDDCISEDGISEFGQRIIESGTYVEKSPSGKGLRAVYTGGAVITGKANAKIENGERVEIYCGSAYVTITGDKVMGSGDPIDLPKKLKRELSPVIENQRATNDVTTRDDRGVLMHPDASPIPEFTEDHARHVLERLPKVWGTGGSGTWYKVAAALHHQFAGSEEGYAILDDWSQGIDGYDERANRARWVAGFDHAKSTITTMKNLVHEAKQNGTLRVKPETMEKWRLSRPVDKDFDPDIDDVIQLPELPDHKDLLQLMSIREKIATPPPPVDWLVENFIAKKNVTMLAGGSGTSKSYLAMQMCSLAAVGVETFGNMKIREGGFRTAYFAYEDADSVMHTRISMLKRYLLQRLDGDDFDEEGELNDSEEDDEEEGYSEPDYDVSFLELWNDNFLLATTELLDNGAWLFLKKDGRYGEVKETELKDYLVKFITDNKIDLLVLDTASETHEVEENSTGDMVALMRIFRQVTNSADCAVLVVQHIQKGAIVSTLDELNQSNIRGSSAFVDKARNAMMLARMPKGDATKYGLPDSDHTHDNVIAMKHVKANLGDYNPLTFFERTSTGVLAHMAGVKLLDVAPLDDKDETARDRNIAKAQSDMQTILKLITRENKEDVYPTAVYLRTQANTEHGVSDSRARTAIQALENTNQIEKHDDGFSVGYKLVDD